MESTVDEVSTELHIHRDTLASLSKQMKLLRHVPLDVATLRHDLLNIIAQFPTRVLAQFYFRCQMLHCCHSKGRLINESL